MGRLEPVTEVMTLIFIKHYIKDLTFNSSKIKMLLKNLKGIKKKKRKKIRKKFLLLKYQILFFLLKQSKKYLSCFSQTFHMKSPLC